MPALFFVYRVVLKTAGIYTEAGFVVLPNALNEII
jgi:hypothetical protein